MTEELYYEDGAAAGMSQIHDDVTNQLSQVIGSAPGVSVFESTQGLIASPVTTQLSAALPSRESVLGFTQTASQTIRDLVSKAGQLYEQGDTEGAAKLRAAAETLESQQGGEGGSGGATGGAQNADGSGGSGSASSGTSGSGSSGSGSSGADTASQMASQVGQQVGQLGQTLAQSVQGLAAIPGQIMQGVQGIVQSAVGAGGTGGSLDDKAEQDGKGDPDDKARPGEEDGPDDKARPGDKGEAGPAPRDKAEPGGHGEGLIPKGTLTPHAPAQTRPQQSPL